MRENQGSSFRSEMWETVSKLQEVSGTLQSYAREQQRLREDLSETRLMMRELNALIRDGNPSLITQVYLLKIDVEALKTSQLRTRDWWLKLLIPLVSAVVIALAGIIALVYRLTSTTPVLKP